MQILNQSNEQDVIQIFILSRDRPEYLKQTIDSVLNQKEATIKFKLIVSDNSEKQDVEKMVKKNYKDSDFKFIRRNPPMSARDHFQLIVSELREKYAVLFHDDDIMRPDYVETMSSFLPKDGVAAVGCNALAFEDDISKVMYKLHSFTSVKEYSENREFLGRYLPGKSGIAPFSGHIYNTKILQKIPRVDSLMSGKHVDVVIMDSLLKYGAIVWLPNVLMYCRNHKSNDSNIDNIPSQISLLNYMKRRKGLSDLVALRRLGMWRKWLLRQDIKNLLLWRNRIVFKFLLFKSFYFLHKKLFWKVIFMRIMKRFTPTITY
jgi:glycosyltransferase involved in cell wall biosynthesis